MTQPSSAKPPPDLRRLGDPQFFADVPESAAACEALAPVIPDLAVRQACQLFGDTALVPFTFDRPLPDDALKDLPLAERLAMVSQQPFGVVCGSGPEPLGALLLPGRLLAPFLKANPGVRSTTIFRAHEDGSVGCFLRSPALPLTSREDPSGAQWLSGGSPLLLLDRAKQLALTCLQPLPTRRIKLAELDWSLLPELGLELTVAEIAGQHGPELLPGKGYPALNPAFWAAFYLAHFQVRYHPAERRFYRRGDESTELGEALIQEDLVKLLYAWSQRPNCQPLIHYREPRHLRRIIAQMKTLGGQFRPSQQAELMAFLERSVSVCPGASVTTDELYRAYGVFYSLHGLPAGSMAWFAKAAARTVKEKFQVAKSHSIQRDGKPQRGFRNLALTSPG